MSIKKVIIALIFFLLLVTAGIIAVIFHKNDKKELPKITDDEVVEDITEEKSTEAEEESLIEITDVVFLDKTDSIKEEDVDTFINEVSAETDRYLKLIFNYSSYSDEYKNSLLAGMADTERWPRTKYYYADAIIQSFEDNEVVCSTNKVNILSVTVGTKIDDSYEVTVRGYIDINFSSKDIAEGKKYIPFEDHLCKEKDNITHFDPSFNHMLNPEGFKCGLVDEMTKTVRYMGTSVFEFNLEQYNPEYEQAQKIEEEYEKTLEEEKNKLASDTDSTEE